MPITQTTTTMPSILVIAVQYCIMCDSQIDFARWWMATSPRPCGYHVFFSSIRMFRLIARSYTIVWLSLKVRACTVLCRNRNIWKHSPSKTFSFGYLQYYRVPIVFLSCFLLYSTHHLFSPRASRSRSLKVVVVVLLFLFLLLFWRHFAKRFYLQLYCK